MTQPSSPAAIQDKLLTILIPVYNGEKYLRNLLQLFADAFSQMPELFAKVEIVVGNNVSSDQTQAVAESFISALPILRPLSLTPHFPTAELNIFRAFCLCRGIFTWTLGVDDIPVFSSFANLIEHLEGNRADFYLFNFAVVSSKMLISRNSIFYMSQSEYPINIVDVTQRFGFWFTLAGISGQIMRTSMVKDYDLAKMYETTNKIYVHVCAYLECFKSERTIVVNLPIVFYKVTPNDFAHWKNAAKKMDVFDEFFWTLGYVRQLVYLEQKGIIDSNYLHYMIETNEQNFFRPVFVVAEKFANQVMIMSKTDDLRNQCSEAEFDEVANYLTRKEPFLREYFWNLKRIFLVVLEGQETTNKDWDELKAFSSVFADFPLASNIQMIFGDYEIYRVADVFYAVHRNSRDVLLDRLCYFFDEELPPEVFSGKGIDVLIGKITAYYHDIDNQDRIIRRQSFNRSGLVERNSKAVAAELEFVKDNLNTAQRDYFNAIQNFNAVTRSMSWRITKPLRMGMEIIRRLAKR